MTAPSTEIDQSDLACVADSFAFVHADAQAVGRLFYETLFAAAPQLRPLFGGDLDVQGVKLMDTLHVVVAALGHMEAVRPVIEDLARRHVAYGVRPDHYDLVGETLIGTMARFLGSERFDPHTAAAWRRAYGVLSEAMVAAAYPDMAA
ncbi:MAG: globin domain-containing protein [Pseudomonadota bacterium]